MALEGRTIGHYTLLSKIGEGGMGEVYLANDNNVKRQVAVKFVKLQMSGYETDQKVLRELENFRREATAVARMHHPHILTLHDYAKVILDGQEVTYMVMPYCPQGSLEKWIKHYSPHQPLPVEDVVHFVKQAADALQYAHNEQIIHKDVKPDNFLLRKHHNERLPDLLLADFGIASLMSATVSITNVSGGTPLYMAPEQFSNKPVFASDQYSLAMMAYYFLTGHHPFKGTTFVSLMYQHTNEKPTAPSRINPQLHYAIDEVVLQGLAKTPERRFLSIMEFANALEKAVQWQSSRLNVTIEKGRPEKETTHIPPITSSPNSVRIPVSTSPQPIKELDLNSLRFPIFPIAGVLLFLDIIAFFVISTSLRILLLAILIVLESVAVMGMALYNMTRANK